MLTCIEYWKDPQSGRWRRCESDAVDGPGVPLCRSHEAMLMACHRAFKRLRIRSGPYKSANTANARAENPASSASSASYQTRSASSASSETVTGLENDAHDAHDAHFPALSIASVHFHDEAAS